MTVREAIHQLIDDLPETELPTAHRVLEALQATSRVDSRGTLRQMLDTVPFDDESGEDDVDGGLTEAREELSRGGGLSTAELLAALDHGS